MSVNTIHLTPQSQTLRFLRLGVRIKYLREKNRVISEISR
jgi:hypothetical protein